MRVYRTIVGRPGIECQTQQDELLLSLTLRLAEREAERLTDTRVKTAILETIKRIASI